jgi:hypothetical protein
VLTDEEIQSMNVDKNTSNNDNNNLNNINNHHYDKIKENEKNNKKEENKKVFLLISCNFNKIKKVLNFNNNTKIQKFELQHTEKEKKEFQSFTDEANKVVCYAVNGTEDIILAVPNNYYDADNDNNNDHDNNNNNNMKYSDDEMKGIGIESVSICISPPLSLPHSSAVVQGRTMKSIEMTLELLTMPTISSSSSSSSSDRYATSPLYFFLPFFLSVHFLSLSPSLSLPPLLISFFLSVHFLSLSPSLSLPPLIIPLRRFFIYFYSFCFIYLDYLFSVYLCDLISIYHLLSCQ